MPIRIKTDIDFGQKFYLQDDPEQLPHTLIGYNVRPGNVVKLVLSYCGEECEVYDFEASTVRDEDKYAESRRRDDE